MTASIRFEAAVDSVDSPPRELLCTIWPVQAGDAGSDLGDPVLSNTPVSVGDSSFGSSSDVTLPQQGSYLVEVELPNGQSTRRIISVKEDQAYRFVVHDRRYSATSAPSATRPEPIATRSGAWFRGDVHELVAAAARPDPDADLEVRLLETAEPIGLDQLKAHLSQGSLAPGIEGTVLRRGAEKERFVTMALPSREGVCRPGDTARSWLRVSGSGANATLIAYPSSWPTRGPRDPFRLVARRAQTTGPEASKWRVGLELTDPAYGALVEYLNRRDIQSSQIISKTFYGEARSALSEESSNPVAAALGAYMFALADSWPGPGLSCLERLQADFPSVPDLSIALGWRQLREAERDAPGWKQARQMLWSAMEQGLPFYTLGLHILVDALNLLALAEPDDPEVCRWLSVVTALDTACVRKEPFTTLQVSRFMPSMPST